MSKIIVTTMITIIIFVLSFNYIGIKKEEDNSELKEEIKEEIQDFEIDEEPNKEIEEEPQEVENEDTNKEEIEEKQLIQTLLCCTAEKVNIRTKPSVNSTSLGTIDKDECVLYVDKKEGWYQTFYKGQTAYVSSKYVKRIDFNLIDKEEIENVILEGFKLLGSPYVYGAQRYMYSNGQKNPNFNKKEYDCSSLMQYIFYLGANEKLDVTTRLQIKQGTKVKKEDLKRGDLLFFTNASRYYNKGIERVGHVALYLGNNYILHTASDYATVEIISKTRWNYFLEARRIIN